MSTTVKKDFAINIYIGLSYFLLLALVELMASKFNLDNFRKAYSYVFWQNIYVLFVNLVIFHPIKRFIDNKRNKFIWIILITLTFLLFHSIGFFYWGKIGNFFLEKFETSNNDEFNFKELFLGVVYIAVGVFYFSFLKIVIGNVQLKNKNQALLIEKKESELNFLKSQTNPHFLFNTLNNIYSLIHDNADLAANSVLRLANILRYMLYNTQSELVSIAEELKIIDEYIELEKIRYNDILNIRFNKKIDNYQKGIPPLLLISIVENAFKHGVSNTIYFPFIDIDISLNKDQLYFTVKNSIEPDTSISFTENIGLRNLRRQLELLFKQFKLNIEKEDSSFSASIYINLSSYAKD